MNRPYVLQEATYRQALDLKPNLAILPWGATEAHNYHLPHGTDNYEATHLAETAAKLAFEQGARCVVLPTVPFGNNNTQLTQVATITMRSATQLAVLNDVAESLTTQGIDRLIILNFHGGNEFKALIRDVMLNWPIFIVQIHGYMLAQELLPSTLDDPRTGHADEFETSLMLHLEPKLVRPLTEAGDGAVMASKLPKLTGTPGIWAPRDWASLTKDTGDGNPTKATTVKGKKLFEKMVERLAGVLVELSNASIGEFPFVIQNR